MDRFFLNNEESDRCLSCMGNTYWSSSSLPNMNAIHWRIKVTNFVKRLTWDNARRPANACPDIAILKDKFFEKPVQKFMTAIKGTKNNIHT